MISVYVDIDMGQLAFLKRGRAFSYAHHHTLDLGLMCRHLRTDRSPSASPPSCTLLQFRHEGDSITFWPTADWLADH